MKQTWIGVIGLTILLAGLTSAVAQEPRKISGLPPNVKAVRNVAYVPNGHERQVLDLYVPEKAEGRLPLIVWVHGGGWLSGNKEGCPALFLTAKGYAVASINYRLSQHAVFPAQIEDCKAAIRWLRANAAKYHLDPDHIGAWGGSAGGHLVALLGTTNLRKELEGKDGNLDQSSGVQCVVDFFGPSDFVHWDPEFNKGVNEMIGKLLGGPAPMHPEEARKASPIQYVGKDAVPFLILHGDKDNIVPLSQSESLADALKKAGKEAQLVVLKGSGHGGPGFDNAKNRKLIEEFFDKHLKK
jgi:acetyl esterase/lipase